VPPAVVVTLSRVIGRARRLTTFARSPEVPPACLSQLFVAGRRHRHGASWVTRDGWWRWPGRRVPGWIFKRAAGCG